MNNALLNKKIMEIQTLPQFPDGKISIEGLSDFTKVFRKLKGLELYKMNPVTFAKKYGFNEEETIQFFVFGAKTGLFTFEWNLLCPLCGGREHSYLSLNQLEKETYHCTLCDVDVEVQADSHLEVSFTVSPVVQEIPKNHHASIADYWSWFFSPDIVWTPEVNEAWTKQPELRFISIAPGKTGTVSLGVTRAMKHRFATFDTHSIFNAFMKPDGTTGNQKIELVHTDKGFNKKEVNIYSATGEISIVNKSAKTIGCIIGSPVSEEIRDAVSINAPYFNPFVSGKMMLNHQIFRDLFLIDNLPDDLSLRINDITLLFTDLKGSTELYDKTGDVNAYRLVQKHFKILQTIVQEFHGGIVKTMGDAIMASFNTPVDGIQASFSMQKEIEAFNKTIMSMEHAIGLKIGLHRGSAIAVKANQTLDYFGQTVNIAARVQNLANSGEIWITDDMMRDQNTAGYLNSRGCRVNTKEVALKGVGSNVTVHLCSR